MLDHSKSTWNRQSLLFRKTSYKRRDNVDNWVDSNNQKDFGTIRAFRKILEETPNIAAVYGWMQWLIGGVFFVKLAKLLYNTNLHLEPGCIVMGYELIAASFRVTMFHSQDKIDYCKYRIKRVLIRYWLSCW